jgi:TatD DNase family protein
MYAEEFKDDRKSVIEKAINSGVSKMFLPNIDLHSIQPMLDVCWDFPENCFPMMGLHPCSVDANVEAHLFQIQKWFKKRKFYAVGEIGLDYYWSIEFKEQQLHAFKLQIQWAIQMNLPIVIHSRNSNEDVIKTLKEFKHPKLRGIFHCFGGSLQEAQEVIALGFLLGIGGVISFKNSGLDKVVEEIDLSHLVLETDSPYLAPVPHRGKRNESAYLVDIAKKVAEIKKVGLNQVSSITSENALRVFDF